jgi:hypothetical protein
LAIILISSHLANEDMESIAGDYYYDARNRKAISDLQAAQKPLNTEFLLNASLCGMLALDFLVNGCCLGKNLRSTIGGKKTEAH